MSDIHVALKDANSVASAIFESSTQANVILRGKIDPITGRILVDSAGGGGGTLTWYDVSGTIDGINDTFTIPVSPASGIILNLGGQLQVDTEWYTVSGSTITYQSGFIPANGIPSNQHKAGVIT